MKEMRIKSVIPIYLMGVTWLLYAFFLPLYRLTDLVIAAAVSLIVYILSSKLIPDKTVMVKEEVKFDKTGIAQTDEVIVKGREYIAELRRLNDKISNAQLSNNISQLATISEKIFSFISKNPDNTRQIKTFMDYYYPTAIKLLNSYIELNSQDTAGDNISVTIKKIENVMGSMVPAFKKQLDNLFADKALDISTDIDVLNNILSSEGLNESGKTGGLRL